uniref:Uncharacterized protein n=1 Tax=Anguilla anguilla TaxID=7936 RepID=A0A0E9S227_ANGAN
MAVETRIKSHSNLQFFFFQIFFLRTRKTQSSVLILYITRNGLRSFQQQVSCFPIS